MARRKRLLSKACWNRVRMLARILVSLVVLLSADDAEQRAKDAIVVRTLMRLPGIDLSTRPDSKAALLRHLDTVRGSEQYLELVERFKLYETSEELLRLALDEAAGTLSVKAAGLLVKFDQRDL